MILDVHAHVAGSSHLPDAFFDGWAENLAGTLPGGAAGGRGPALRALLQRVNSDPGCERLLAEMDEAGIARTVLLVVDFGFAFPEARDAIDVSHAEVRALLRTGRFIGFAGVDPRRGEAGVRRFELALRDEGFVGMKLYPPCGYSPSDPRLFPYYELCAQHGAPVLVHTGPTSSRLSFQHARPLEIDEAALRFPRVPFILAHGAVVWHEDAALLAEYRPNVHLDLAGFQPLLRRGGLASTLDHHLRRGLARKLLFGTDWPIYRLFGTQREWVEAVRRTLLDLGQPEGVVADVLGGNLRRLLPSRAAVGGGE